MTLLAFIQLIILVLFTLPHLAFISQCLYYQAAAETQGKPKQKTKARIVNSLLLPIPLPHTRFI